MRTFSGEDGFADIRELRRVFDLGVVDLDLEGGVHVVIVLFGAIGKSVPVYDAGRVVVFIQIYVTGFDDVGGGEG